ncbi:MAG: glycosyl hydrolase family 25 [Oscillospiraceae bacterium]|nr:glycosyl hydrolase family 25 [Oscillospiraceae bacterium]
MKKILKALITAAAVLFLIFITVFILAKKKIIFLNEWFVNEKNSTIGVDISSYQADVDMEKLREQGIRFVFIKATEGSSSQDEMFPANWENAKNAGLPAGAYHFFSYDSPGSTQAENFINTVGDDLKGRLLPVVDVEYYGDKEENPPAKEDIIRELTVFLNALEAKYGARPMIYTRSDIYYRYLEGFSKEYRMWISSLYTPLGWNYKEDWYIWQYLNRGVLEGYTGGEQYVDLNILNKEKDLDDLIIK